MALISPRDSIDLTKIGTEAPDAPSDEILEETAARLSLLGFGRVVTPITALADGVTDDTDAILWAKQQAVSKRLPLHIPPGRYRLTQPIAHTSGDFVLKAQGATFIVDGDISPINIDLPFTDGQDVGSITTQTFDLSGGTASTTVVSRLEGLADTSGYAVDDWIKVTSDDIQPGTDPANKERLGEYARVAAKTSTTLTLYSLLEESYATGVRVYRMSRELVYIEHPSIELASGALVSWNEQAIKISGAVCPIVIGAQAKSSGSAFIEFTSCIFANTFAIHGENLRTSAADNAQGYVISEYSCWGGRHISPSGANIRNVYTTGCKSSEPGDDAPKNRGRTRRSVVTSPMSINSQGSTWSTHSGAVDCVVISPIAIAPFNGPSNAARAVVLKGRGHKVIGLRTNGNGVYVLQDYDDPLNCGDHIIDGLDWDGRGFSGGYAVQALNVSAGAANKIRSVKVVNARLRNSGGFSPFLNLRGAEIEVIAPDMIWTASGATTARWADLDDGSKLKVKGGQIDYTGSTATSIRGVTCIDAASVAEIDDFTWIPGASAWQGLGDLNNATGTMIFRRNNVIGAAPSLALGVYNIGSGATVSVDYAVDNSRTSTRARLTGSTVSSAVENATITLDLAHRGAPVVWAEVNPTAAGISVAGSATTAKGKFIGQILTLVNVGTQPFILKHNTTARMNIGADTTVAANAAKQLIWTGDTTGTGWRPFS